MLIFHRRRESCVYGSGGVYEGGIIIPGPVYSGKASKAWQFISRAGAVPFDSVHIATGMKKGDCNKALNILRGAGYAYPEIINGIEWWISVDSSVSIEDRLYSTPHSQELLAWFIARLQEAGGCFNDGIARYPKGQELLVLVSGNTVQTGDMYAILDDLKTKPLRECLKKTVTVKS